MKAVTLLLVSGVIVVAFLGGCHKEKPQDAVWNRDGLGNIVELEPAPEKDFPLDADREEEKEEKHWCAA